MKDGIFDDNAILNVLNLPSQIYHFVVIGINGIKNTLALQQTRMSSCFPELEMNRKPNYPINTFVVAVLGQLLNKCFT